MKPCDSRREVGGVFKLNQTFTMTFYIPAQSLLEEEPTKLCLAKKYLTITTIQIEELA